MNNSSARILVLDKGPRVRIIHGAPTFLNHWNLHIRIFLVNNYILELFGSQSINILKVHDSKSHCIYKSQFLI